MSICPIPGCRVVIDPKHVMCRRHWFKAPAEVREAVWNEYRLAPGSPAHLEAIHLAIASVMEKEAPAAEAGAE